MKVRKERRELVGPSQARFSLQKRAHTTPTRNTATATPLSFSHTTHHNLKDDAQVCRRIPKHFLVVRHRAGGRDVGAVGRDGGDQGAPVERDEWRVSGSIACC